MAIIWSSQAAWYCTHHSMLLISLSVCLWFFSLSRFSAFFQNFFCIILLSDIVHYRCTALCSLYSFNPFASFPCLAFSDSTFDQTDRTAALTLTKAWKSHHQDESSTDTVFYRITARNDILARVNILNVVKNKLNIRLLPLYLHLYSFQAWNSLLLLIIFLILSTGFSKEAREIKI